MGRVENTTPLSPPPGRAVPPLTAGSWQEAVQPLVGLVAWHALRLCRIHGVPPGDRDDVVAEALAAECVGVRSAFARGVAGVDCSFYARNGLAAARTRRGRRLRLLGDLLPGPGALASRAPGPYDEAEANDTLASLLARLPAGRVRRVVRLRAQGLSVAEVARREGVCVQRIRQLLLQARQLLLAR
jgi:DNA-directed RNA polymerase specialized sigma24 family protein